MPRKAPRIAQETTSPETRPTTHPNEAGPTGDPGEPERVCGECRYWRFTNHGELWFGRSPTRFGECHYLPPHERPMGDELNCVDSDTCHLWQGKQPKGPR